MALFPKSTLRRSAEFERIKHLERRRWTPEQMEQCAAYYTQQFKTPTGTMALRPLQGVAIHEMLTQGGLLGPIRVGGGKTLISFLAALVFRALRPVLLLPASLVEKTRREMGQLMNHWQIPRNIFIQSYETLGRENAAKWLDQYAPDLIVTDESHRLKNLKAGVTRRVKRYMAEHPNTRFVAISGTLYKDDLEDFGHLAHWALKSRAPVPLTDGELKEWSDCLAAQVNPMNTVRPGPLLELAAPEDHDTDEQAMARKAFRRRLLETPGVVASMDDAVACSLYVKGIIYQPNTQTEDNFRTLRTMWETPDGWALTEAVDVWRHARELALGFHYVWDPRPPAEWLEARRQWASRVRQVLSHSKTLDTELQVRHAAVSDIIPRFEWDAWEAIQPTFTIQPKAIWHDDTALKLCEKWASEGPGIIWTEHSFFAKELARRTGLHYYGQEGLNSEGKPIELADPKRPLIASVRANSTGRNLQAWCRNLITSAMGGAPAWEQCLGRTHRDGQEADTVTVDVLFGCREHWDNFTRAVEKARASEQTLGHAQKLLIGDIVVPSRNDVDTWARTSLRWDRSAGKETVDL